MSYSVETKRKILNIESKFKSVKLAMPDKSIQVYYYWRENINANGKTIVVLPGLDESIQDYQQLINELKNYSVLAIDLRGQGRTLEDEKQLRSITITLDQQVFIINEVIKDLNITKINLLGLSYGAGVGLYFANRCEKVIGLFLLAPYVSKFKIFDKGFIGFWYLLLHMNPFYRAISFFTLPFYFQVAKKRGRLNPLINWDKKHLRALTKLSTGIMQLSTTKEAQVLKPLENGFHILIGEKDDLVSRPAVKYLLEQVKLENKTLEFLPQAGHRLLINNAHDCANWINRYLN
jgi:pimeloyl-ACP methyl ester carboxylesterase